LTTLITGATIIDGTGRPPAKDSIIAIEGTQISFVGLKNQLSPQLGINHTIIDATGKTVLPGLINMHDHLVFKYAIGSFSDHIRKGAPNLTLFAAKTALDTLRSGITTIRDMATKYGISIAIREAINTGRMLGPRIIACNQPICATGGHASEVCCIADGPEAVRRAARKQLSLGADFVKVMASHDPYEMPSEEKTRAELTQDEIRAAFDEARKWGKKTACHVMGQIALRNVIEQGVDIIDHGIYLDERLVSMMAEKHIVYSPTLSGYCCQTMNPRFERGEKWASDHQPLIEPLKRSFEIAIKAGLKIVCSTDSTGRYAEEVALMREAGMSPMDTILACTAVAAQALGMGDLIGTIEAGKKADLVLLNADPLKNPYALEEVFLVIKDGMALYPHQITL